MSQLDQTALDRMQPLAGIHGTTMPGETYLLRSRPA